MPYCKRLPLYDRHCYTPANPAQSGDIADIHKKKRGSVSNH